MERRKERKQMILSKNLQTRVDHLEKMGKKECEDFKQEVINSLLDNPTKFYLYDLIDARIKNLSQAEAMIVNEDPFISGFEVEV